MKRNVHGFTLVELLIVAVVLAIFAAIVVPQFASTTDDARDSALRSDLAGIRSAIELYRQQHNEYPGAVTAVGGADCSTGTASAATEDTAGAFLDQLRMYTKATGEACSHSNGGSFPFGPYLREDNIPTNAVTGDDTLVVLAAGAQGDLDMGGAGAGGGWRYDPTTGKFIADDTNTDASGTRYDEY